MGAKNDDYIRQIREMVARDRRAQGLPDRIQDPAALRKLAALIAVGRPQPADAHRSGQRVVTGAGDVDGPSRARSGTGAGHRVRRSRSRRAGREG